MTILRKYLFLFILIITVVSVNGSDSLRVKTFNSFRITDYRNLWSGTENMTGLIFTSTPNLVGVYAGMDDADGSYHKTMDPSNYQIYSLSTKSYKKIGKYTLYGGFAYNNLLEKGSRWNGTYDPYRGSPYILGDSISNSIYRKENYSLTGGVATTLNEHLMIGCKIDYFVGVGAKQKDPRPLNTVVQFLFNPGIIWNKKSYNLGLDLGYLNRQEEISYLQNITDNPDPAFYFFKGFGFYAKEIGTSYSRFQSLSEYFGAIQFEKKQNKNRLISELRFKYGMEQINDGSSAVIKQYGGDWKAIDFRLNETAKFGENKKLHTLLISAGFFDGDGTEYTQDKVYKGNIAEYVTIAKNLKFNRRRISGNLRHEFQRLNDSGQLDWSVWSGLAFLSNEETYYYIPEIFTSKYTNLTGDLSLEKNLYVKSFHFAPRISFSYVQNLNGTMLLSDLTEITKKQMKDIYTADFNYYAGNQFKFSGQLVCGYFPVKIKHIDQLFFSLDYTNLRSITLNDGFSVLSGKIGFIF
ncbi:MAG: DUF6850 family outer membrane beta-barrel protein [Prolixibacteraceae bacterium]